MFHFCQTFHLEHSIKYSHQPAVGGWGFGQFHYTTPLSDFYTGCKIYTWIIYISKTAALDWKNIITLVGLKKATSSHYSSVLMCYWIPFAFICIFPIYKSSFATPQQKQRFSTSGWASAHVRVPPGPLHCSSVLFWLACSSSAWASARSWHSNTGHGPKLTSHLPFKKLKMQLCQ